MNTVNDTTSRKVRPRGTGRLYQPKRNSRWWMKYYRDGKPIRESTGTDNKRLAEKILQKRLAQIATHTYVDPKSERRLVRELFELLRLDYQNNDLKSWDDVEARWRLHVERFFGNFRAVNVTKADLDTYVNARKQSGASNATVNRELAVLKRMFTLGEVSNAPKFPHLKETNVRKGFVEDSQYTAIAMASAKRGLWLRAMFEAGYSFGWRVSELLNLRVRQVDLASRTIRLEVGETKNNEAREAYMPERLFLLIQQCVTGKEPDDYVFTRDKGGPVRDFRGAWEAATREAGVPGLLFHDLRRTAVRNMVRAGIPERVAMMISGHKTRAVFDRYNIVALEDRKLAAQRMDARDRSTFGHHTGSIGEFLPISKPMTTLN